MEVEAVGLRWPWYIGMPSVANTEIVSEHIEGWQSAGRKRLHDYIQLIVGWVLYVVGE